MKKALFAALAFVIMVGVAIVLPFSTAYAVETFIIETETRQYNPEKSFGGYFLTSDDSTANQTVYLMDMMGYVIRQWSGVRGTPKLLENGNLWSCGQVQDWDGNILWSFTPSTDMPTRFAEDQLSLHHDGRRIWNKKLKQYTHLYVAYRNATKEEVIAAGGDPSWSFAATAGAKGNTSRLMAHDLLIEVNDKKEIVWEWRHLDHQVQSKNPAWPNYVTDVAKAPGREDAHYGTGIGYDWQHINSVDYNEDLDLIVTNGRSWSQSYVIDHGKTFVSATDWAANRAAAKGPSGDFLYRFGNPATYNQGYAPSCSTTGQQCYEGDQQLYGSHDIQWIKPYHWNRPHAEAGDTWPDPVGYTLSGIANPGAGHFMVFDNGTNNPTGMRSRIREFNPFLNSAGVDTGWFVNPPDAGYTGTLGLTRTSKQIVWNYQSKSQQSFYSVNTSGCQRLPNGNTSIQSSAQGHSFEVTPTGEVVWEYQFPGFGTANAKFVMYDGGTGNAEGGTTKLFRHYRYGANYPGLAGRDLTPTTTITGNVPRLIGEGRETITPVYGFGFGNAAFGGGSGGGVGGSGGSGSGY
ncbi:MAG: aryl-sulfate sulfotransferase [Deltaproteobacteria bacterium]